MQHVVLADQDFADFGFERGETTLELGGFFGKTVRHGDFGGGKCARSRGLSTGRGRGIFPGHFGMFRPMGDVTRVVEALIESPWDGDDLLEPLSKTDKAAVRKELIKRATKKPERYLLE